MKSSQVAFDPMLLAFEGEDKEDRNDNAEAEIKDIGPLSYSL